MLWPLLPRLASLFLSTWSQTIRCCNQRFIAHIQTTSTISIAEYSKNLFSCASTWKKRQQRTDHMTNAFGSANPQQSQAKVKTISEIVSALIKAHQTNKPIDVDRLKSRLAGQNGLSDLPKMVDIIAAIPEQYRKALLPALKTKPVRTASGVRNISKWENTTQIKAYSQNR